MLRRLTLVVVLAALIGLAGCGQNESYDSHFTIPEESKNKTRFTIKFGRVPSLTVTDYSNGTPR